MEQCKLCLKFFEQLEDSHFLPRGIYKRLRDENKANPNPFRISPRGVVQTSQQLKAHLLCHHCEQRFNKYGEDWVLRHCLQQDGRFPLASVLSVKPPDVSSPSTPTKLYYAAAFPEIDISALAYFGTSIFWRGSIHPWRTDGTIPVQLGQYQEPIRHYLLDEEAFPQDCALYVVVRERSDIDRLTYAPAGQRTGTFHSYRFPMPGLVFILMVGKRIPQSYREKCIVRGTGNPLIITSILERSLFKEAVKALGNQPV